MRWIMRLQEFDLDITHRKGKKSGNVDALTREPALGEHPYDEDETEELYSRQDDDRVIATVAKLKATKVKVGKTQAETEKKDIIQEELDHKHNEEPKNAGSARKPFFDCEQDKDGTSLETLIKEQAGFTSKQLRVIRESIGKDVEHGLSFSMRDDRLIIMKRKPEKVGRVVVPECLRAYVLRMFHNSQMAAHQGKNRTVKQITESFYWPVA